MNAARHRHDTLRITVNRGDEIDKRRKAQA